MALKRIQDTHLALVSCRIRHRSYKYRTGNHRLVLSIACSDIQITRDKDMVITKHWDAEITVLPSFYFVVVRSFLQTQ